LKVYWENILIGMGIDFILLHSGNDNSILLVLEIYFENDRRIVNWEKL
jgi:hypothetical protein